VLKLDCGAAAAAHLRAEDVRMDVKDRMIAMLSQRGWLVRRQEPTTTMISSCIAQQVKLTHETECPEYEYQT
jgi:hypothetical protein